MAGDRIMWLSTRCYDFPRRRRRLRLQCREGSRDVGRRRSLLKCRCLELGLEVDWRASSAAVDTWEAMTSQYCRKRRKKVLVSAEIAVPDTDRESCWPCPFLEENHDPIESNSKPTPQCGLANINGETGAEIYSEFLLKKPCRAGISWRDPLASEGPKFTRAKGNRETGGGEGFYRRVGQSTTIFMMRQSLFPV